MADADNLLSEGDIDVSNVRPAYEASLACGVTAARLAAELGWDEERLRTDGASVSGASTYRHMELMYAELDYPAFVLDAVARHGAASLGVVGLACKTAETVGEALACHGRFQHLTNRTARYRAETRGEALVLEERRGDPSRGSRLLSDYTMLIAHRLLTLLAAVPPAARVMTSRRPSLPPHEREAFEAAVGAPIETGAERASLVFDAHLGGMPVVTADPELRSYFTAVLERAAPGPDDEPELVQRVRLALRDAMARGTPSVDEVARQLGLGPRTLQRRLSAHGTTFARTLESSRRALAEAYLADASLSLAEVAFLLGYAEQPSFYRAFRRWFGTTPDAFRRRP